MTTPNSSGRFACADASTQDKLTTRRGEAKQVPLTERLHRVFEQLDELEAVLRRSSYTREDADRILAISTELEAAVREALAQYEQKPTDELSSVPGHNPAFDRVYRTPL